MNTLNNKINLLEIIRTSGITANIYLNGEDKKVGIYHGCEIVILSKCREIVFLKDKKDDIISLKINDITAILIKFED